jgi:hypothetical protein
MNGLGAALLADGPHASLGEQEYDGRVMFGWIIDGWAVQDVWSGGGASARRSAGSTRASESGP